MKTFIKKYIPTKFKNWYSHIKQEFSIRFDKTSTITVFEDIYHKNTWGSAESVSGTGSELRQTQKVITAIEKIINDYNIQSILDAPCGDFNWMQYVKMTGLNYTGIDIVEAIIVENKKKFKQKNIQFISKNILTDSLDHVDLIICRDCLPHFSYQDTIKAIRNFKSSKSRYLLTTTYTSNRINRNIKTGDWRPIDLTQAPYHFPIPLLMIQENSTEFDNQFQDKTLALWEIQSLPY